MEGGIWLRLFLRRRVFRSWGRALRCTTTKGCGFLEAVYQECLEIEYTLQELPFTPQSELQLTYKGRVLRKTYQPDFLCFEKIIVEIKAVSDLTDEHRAQVHNNLKATGFRLGLLINFGAKNKLQSERIVR